MQISRQELRQTQSITQESTASAVQLQLPEHAGRGKEEKEAKMPTAAVRAARWKLLWTSQ